MLHIVKNNIKTLFLSAPNFIQFLYIAKVLWWGVGGVLGVRFLIEYLNYLVVYPANLCLIVVGLIGLIGLLFNKYFFNIIFAFLMVFISSCIGLTFLRNALDTISAGTYFIDIFGAIWLTFRIQYMHLKDSRNLWFGDNI
jgi:hypothetical protein